MSLVNEIQAARFNDLLHKLLGMKEGAPSPQISPEIQPVIVLENDRPEYDFLRNVRRGASAGSTSSSAAAKFQQLSVVNPAGSGVIAVVTDINVMNSAHAPLVDVRLGCTVGAATGGTSRNLDLRFGNQALATSVFVEEVAAITGVVAYRARGPANASLFIPLTIVLGPGNSVFFVDITASAAAGEINQLNVAIRERAIEPSETR